MSLFPCWSYRLQSTFIRMTSALLLIVGLSTPAQATNISENWQVYDKNPAGASVHTEFDSEINANAVVFTGSQTSNGYSVGAIKGEHSWHDTTSTTVSWQMKYDERYIIYIIGNTTKGLRYFKYTPESQNRGLNLKKKQILMGLGSHSNDGTWQSFSRNIDDDLGHFEPENKLIEINGFFIRGSGRVANIKLSNKRPDWQVYDNKPAGAVISSIYDSEAHSVVSQLSGSKTSNGFALGQEKGNRAWHDTQADTVQWRMNYHENYIIYIVGQTTKGRRYFKYTAENRDRGFNLAKKQILIGLGKNSKNGKWQSFSRNIVDDLAQHEPDNRLIEINGFLIRGSGRVDDVKRTGKREQWAVYDKTPKGAKISMVYEPETESVIASFKGSATKNGYSLGATKGQRAWHNGTANTVTWNMNFSENYIVYIAGNTTNGLRYFKYTPENHNRGLKLSKRQIMIGLGKKSKNGTWQTFSHNLVDDLAKFEPNNRLIEINGFFIRGSGKVNYVELSGERNTDGNNGDEDVSDPKPPVYLQLEVNTQGNGKVNISKGQYKKGSQVTLIATPDNGYVFSGWAGSQNASQQKINITINKNTTLTANFKKKPTEKLYLLDIDVQGGGAVDAHSQYFTKDKKITLTATANKGYVFAGWSGSSYSSNSVLTIKMNSDKRVLAQFKKITTNNEKVISMSEVYGQSTYRGAPNMLGLAEGGMKASVSPYFVAKNVDAKAFYISWGDGSTETVALNKLPRVHTYSTTGEKVIKVQTIFGDNKRSLIREGRVTANKNKDKLPLTQLAFEGATGFGSETKGGRGGKRYIITSLSNGTEPGTIRHAFAAAEPRIVTFNSGLSGVIDLGAKKLEISSPYITVDGSSAGGQGVVLKNAGVLISTHDVIFRNMKIRPGDEAGGEPGQYRNALKIFGTKPRHAPTNFVRPTPYNIIVDHNSMSWSTDQIASTWYAVNNITFSWNIFSEGLADSIHNEGPHSTAVLIGPNSHNVSLHHNLIAHAGERNPIIYNHNSVEMVSNFVYNWVVSGTRLGGSSLAVGDDNTISRANLIGNKYQIGANTPQSSYNKGMMISTRWKRSGGVFLLKNEGEKDGKNLSSDWSYIRDEAHDTKRLIPPLPLSNVVLNPPNSLITILTKDSGAGAKLKELDIVDERIKKETILNMGSIPDSHTQREGFGNYPTFIPSIPKGYVQPK